MSNWRRSGDYYICPECRRKGVTMRFKPNSEDNYACRYCDWYAFTISTDETDLVQLKRLEFVNPGLVA